MVNPREYERNQRRKSQWFKLHDFPNYSINERGKIRNDITGLILHEKMIDGVYYVSLERGSVPARL
jgi:hypothetical protein